MRRIVSSILLGGFLLAGATGCRGDSAVPGKVTITSTEMFKHLKGSKSPPPQKPPP